MEGCRTKGQHYPQAEQCPPPPMADRWVISVLTLYPPWRIRWYGEACRGGDSCWPPLPPLLGNNGPCTAVQRLYVERKVHREAWTGESSLKV